MKRYVAFLRGVSPMNAKMPELKRCFEHIGFTGVKTVLSSGNVVFDAREAAESQLARKAETAMEQTLGRSFPTVVRSVEYLETLLAGNPYGSFGVPPAAKRVVTFLRRSSATKPALPIEQDGARILALNGSEVFSAYVPHPSGPVFMVLLERTFGKEITTRTWGTLEKCVKA